MAARAQRHRHVAQCASARTAILLPTHRALLASLLPTEDEVAMQGAIEAAGTIATQVSAFLSKVGGSNSSGGGSSSCSSGTSRQLASQQQQQQQLASQQQCMPLALEAFESITCRRPSCPLNASCSPARRRLPPSSPPAPAAGAQHPRRPSPRAQRGRLLPLCACGAGAVQPQRLQASCAGQCRARCLQRSRHGRARGISSAQRRRLRSSMLVPFCAPLLSSGDCCSLPPSLWRALGMKGAEPPPSCAPAPIFAGREWQLRDRQAARHRERHRLWCVPLLYCRLAVAAPRPCLVAAARVLRMLPDLLQPLKVNNNVAESERGPQPPI